MLGSVQEEVQDRRRSSVASSASTFSSLSSVSSSDRLQTPRVALTLAEIDTLLDCIADLFDHRNPGVRALAFEVVQLCLLRFGERLTPALRRKVYLRLETHPPGDFMLLQKALRALTQDGRQLEPFHVELGWFLLRLLEQSDAQRDLLGLIQNILRRSPRALDRDKVIAIVSVISARCDMAWSRSDLDACRRFVAFFHVLAAHDLAYAASTPACLRSLCCLVNADGHGTWSVMKLLLNGSSGFLVLKGLLQLLEHPMGVNSPWVLRGAVFFVGMSCWGSQRVPKFDDISWAPILLALEQALECCRGVVIFEVILSLQRLIKKFGAMHPLPTGGLSVTSHDSSVQAEAGSSATSSTSTPTTNRDKRRLVMEWDIILRMLQTLTPWVSMTDENEIEEAPQRTMYADNRGLDENAHRTATIHPAANPPEQPQHQLSVSIQQTRIPRELLDTLQVVEELVRQRQFAGDVGEFLNVLEGYLPHLSENSMLFLLRQRAEAAHPGYHIDWLATLSSTMRTFFSCLSSNGDSLPVPSDVRLEAIEVLRVNLWTSRNVCEDRVIEEVVIPTLGRVYEDPGPEVRSRSLGFIIEVTRQLESVKFDSLLDILANAVTLSSNEDAQLVAPDAELFRMAVKGIKTMLENRAILEDVDVTEVSAKVVASIDYRAFGRTAIADEVERLLNEQAGDHKTTNTTSEALAARHQKAQDESRRLSRSIPLTDAELVRSIHASTRSISSGGGDNTESSFCASVKATAALLAKTQFLSMGIELLQLLVSYEAELQDNALRDLSRCLVGAMELRLAVAEKDLLASAPAADDTTLSSSSSTPNILTHHSEADATNLYGSGTPLGFTSRVLSRFQTSASHGNLFHALSGSVGKSSLGSTGDRSSTSRNRPSLTDRAQLQGFLRQLFDSEFNLLHTTTTALSLLVLLAPGTVLIQLDGILQAVPRCVTTVDGDFRSDAFVAVLEMLGTIVPLLRQRRQDIALSAQKAIVEVLVLGFEYAKSKQLAYLSFRLLCQVIYQSDRIERISLAALAMPRLQECARRANSLLVEAAIDYLMCYAYSQSIIPPSALCGRQAESDKDETNIMADDSSQTRSRTWVYRRSLLTITANSRGDAMLAIRRANCTSRWKLDACVDLYLNPPGDSGDQRGNDDKQTTKPMRDGRIPKKSFLPAEIRQSNSSRANLQLSISSQKLVSSDEKAKIRSSGERDETAYQDTMSSRESEEMGAEAVQSTTTETFQHSTVATAFSPLPAYDGIGGSPSYYCENAQGTKARMEERISRQAEGDDGRERSSGKSVIRAIREDFEEDEDDTVDQQGFTEGESDRKNSEMDSFSLDDSTGEELTVPLTTPRVLQFADSSATATVAPSTRVHGLLSAQNQELIDPMYLMMQLFDLTVVNRPQLLSDGPSLNLALSVLDRTPEYETHKIGLIYVRDEKQTSETAILGNTGGTLRYLRFLRGLGTFTKLEGLPGYTGGLDTTSNSDGKFGLVYKDSCVQECDEEYDLDTLSGQFNDVHIVVQPLNDRQYRTEVHVKPGISSFGPLYGRQIVSSSIISESVRLTCLNANLACQVFHQDLVGFALNCEERLKQIKQLGIRLATADEWKLEE
ncbi:unnamed protein product [Phytophthora fragariaefolia]|uniref:Unnamed protein product n=1 Tax=Phytophthora fragariaefolia TaxID=1490495 RepID=A0A9W6XN41_9STRA|nr:unnamed protein product [Phytophthora fragariaefolia]